MHIWLLSYLAPPQLNAESILVAKTIRFLGKQAEKVTLITSAHDPDFKEDNKLAQYMGDNLIALKRFANGYPTSKIARRLLQRTNMKLFGEAQRIWHTNVNRWSDQQIKAKALPDLLYSRSQPGSSHMAAYHLKRQINVPWVAQFNDPWANNPYHPLKTGDKRLVYEQQVCDLVDHAIFPTQEMETMYVDLYPRLKGRTTVLPHHFDIELYGNAIGLTESSVSEPLKLAYLGDFYGARSPEPLLKALELAEASVPEIMETIEIQFVGNAEQRYQELIREYQKRLSIPVERKPQVNYFESLQLMASSDMLIMIDAPTNENIFLSSKLVDYLGAHRPILGVTSHTGTAANILKQYGYPVADPRDPEAVCTALIQLVSEKEKYMQQALNQDVQAYTSEHVTQRLIDLFQSLKQK